MAADADALRPPGYAVVNPSGNVEGPEIKLGDVLDHLKPFKLRAPFMWVVGGLAVHGKTKGDIDILVHAKTGELPDELWEVIKFRVLRALPPELADRVQFHFEDGQAGPFTDNVPLYDLELADAGREVVRMDAPPAPAELVKTVKPAHFVKPMQPTLAADEGERLTLNTLKRNLLDRKPFPALVQKRLDGATVEFWKAGARVGAFSADGKNLSNSLALAPALVALKRLPHDSLVLVGAVEAWRGKAHLPLDVLADILRSEVGAPKGVKVSATIHDALHLDGDDLTVKGAADRHSAVRSLDLKAPLFVVPSAPVDDADAAAAAAEHMGALPGSGGAVVKAAASTYALGAEVFAVRTAGKDYGLDFYPASGWVESELFMQDWLNREWDLSQLDYETAMEEATEEGAEELKADEPADPYMRIPDEGKTWRYVVQQHARGKSIHSDLRMDIGGELVGWTLNTQIAGAVKEPVETMAALRALKGHSKIVWQTGEWAKRKRGDATVNAEIVSERKGVQPKGWLTFEGVTKPGTTGATTNHPGVFDIVDKGEVEYLSQKSDMHEYTFHGKGLKGRYLFRRLEAGALGKQFVIAPAEGAVPKDTATWVFIKPVDQTPYVLGSRAVGEGWLPPKGVSALPKALRSRVPKELRYWEATGAEALDRRRELRKVWLEADVIKAVGEEKRGTMRTRLMREVVTVPFVLQFHSFRKPDGPPALGESAKHYDLRLDFGEPTLRHWVLSKSPLEHDVTVGWFKRDANKKAMTTEGVFAPGDLTGFNPTADTSAIVKRIDKGVAEVLVDDENAGVFKVRFNGKRLKGVWAFARGDGGEWAVSRLK